MNKLLIGFMAATAAVSAADLTGIWLGTAVSGRRNQVQDFAFQFVQKGEVLTGKAYLDYGGAPIVKGRVDGENISFEVIAREQDGNQVNESLLRFTGAMKDGEIEIGRERVELRNAGNSGASFSRAAKLTFKIRRLPL